jgi:hypothetical protein
MLLMVTVLLPSATGIVIHGGIVGCVTNGKLPPLQPAAKPSVALTGLQCYGSGMTALLTETSKFLSYVLRHQPESIGLRLDREGWATIEDLVERASDSGRTIDDALVRCVVESSDKKRFTISEDGLKIRAAQGHSTDAVKD